MYVLIRKSIDDTIKKYLEFSETIFGESKTTKYDYKALEDVLKKIITEPPVNLPADEPLANQNTRKTFVVAIRTQAGGAAVPMRSYNTPTDDAFPARIWEAARATLAAPLLFDPIIIERVAYGGGEIDWNNPTIEAIMEARKIWPNHPIGCLLSIGTGLEKAIQLNQSRGQSSGFFAQMFQRPAPNDLSQSEIIKYYMDSSTSCEKVHRTVSPQFSDHITSDKNYYRLNVPQGMSEIGHGELEKISDMIALTESYMEHGEMQHRKVTIAKLLLNPHIAG